MTKEEKINAIDEAQEKISEAIDLLEPIAEDDPYFERYFLNHLKIMRGEGHGFVSRDLNLDEERERIEGGENEEGDN